MSGKVHALEQAPTSTSLFTASAHKTHNNGIIPLGMDNHDYVNKQHDVISTSSQNGGVLRKEGAATPSSVSPVESKDAPCDGETEDDETKEPLALCKFFVQRYKLAFGKLDLCCSQLGLQWNPPLKASNKSEKFKSYVTGEATGPFTADSAPELLAFKSQHQWIVEFCL
ncbi:hypothetical protein V1264_019183 [Littorina saxatilis]|uniref:Uncharacterized protein n=1 Tax=Littorina saxatilis TaxID=31220 RepID=A0AAN9BE63_9CAEN